jgi:hypothetical protein
VVCSTYLEDLDLAGAGVHEMTWLKIIIFKRVRLHLYAKRHSLLPTVLLGRELGADTVHLDEDGRVSTSIPDDFDGV